MPKRPPPPAHSYSSPQGLGNVLEVPAISSPNLAPHPRSASPSGLSGFFTKSAKWFGRSSSQKGSIPEQASASRPSFSSNISFSGSSRRPTISHPLDPRPILNVPNAGLGASQSVLDLSSTLEREDFSSQHPFQYQNGAQSSKNVSDLRAMSKRKWSRSVDDLAQYSYSSDPPSTSAPKLAQINTTKVMVEKYRNGSTNSPSSTTSVLGSPRSPRVTNPQLDEHTPRNRSASGGAGMGLGLAYSPSPTLPAVLSTPSKQNPPATSSSSVKGSGISGSGSSGLAIHTRSQSHGPLHPSHQKPIAQPLPPTPTFNRTFVQDNATPPAIPIPSARRRTSSDKEKEKGAFGGFPFHFGGGVTGNHAGKTGGLLTSSPPDGLDNHPLHGSPPQLQVVPPSSNSVEALGASSASTSRASQIIHASGFVNKYDLSSKFSASSSLNLEKGWKPFKAHLQGTKLYLYKPPPDRIGEVKELFGVGPEPERDLTLEAPIDRPSEDKPSDGGAGRKRNISDDGRGRARRAYWGRTTHARLTVVTESERTFVVGGSAEALIHEMVFATTFKDSGFVPHPSPDSQKEEAPGQSVPVAFDDDWTRYARSVMLFLPGYFIEQPSFKTEMKRCMTYLVGGAKDGEEKSFSALRVRWLVQEYQNIWAEESDDAASWRTFLRDEGLEVNEQELSLDALRGRSETGDGDDEGSDVGSSSNTTVVGVGIGTTSTAMTGTSRLPIPASASTWSLLRTASSNNLNGRSLHPSTSSASLNPGRSKIPAIISNAGGLTGDFFIRLETSKIVESLSMFNRSRLAGSILTPGELVSSDLPEEIDELLKVVSGSDEKAHWLTLLVVKHLLEQVGRRGSTDPAVHHPDASMESSAGVQPAGSSTSISQSQQQPQQSASSKANSATYIRAAILSKWIQVGEKCRLAGDEVSWKAIWMGVCCMAVARLEKVWRRVDELDRRMVEKWVKGERAMDGKARGRAKPRRTTWVGDLKEAVVAEVAVAGKSSNEGADDEIRMKPLLKVTKRIEQVVKYWQDATEQDAGVDTNGTEAEQPNEEVVSGDVAALSIHWESLFEENKTRSIPLRHYLSMSYAVESRAKGRFTSSFWKPPTSPYPSTHALIPLLFPEPLPCITLLDRSALVRGKKESLLGLHQSGVEVNEAQIRQVTGGRTAPQKNPTLDAPVDKRLTGGSRTIADSELGERPLPSKDGDLILKIPQEFPRSRPASILDSVPHSTNFSALQISSSEDRKPGRGNSIRLSPARLDRKGSAARSSSRRSSLPSLSQRNSLVIPENPLPDQAAVRALVKCGTLDTLVDILVSGLDGLAEEGYADDNGEVSLREGKARAYKVDHLEFNKIWWCVFRSFMTPIVLFELLRKRYLAASQDDTMGGNHVAFQSEASSVPSRKRVVGNQLRLDVLCTMTNWFTIGGGTQDALDDYQLYQSVHSFLTTTPSVGDSSASDKDGATKEEVERAWENLYRIFTTQISRPSLDIASNRDANTQGPSPRRFGSQPPCMDAVSADDFVENLDSMACTVFRGVTEVHMFELADLLEAQTADRTGWFLSHESNSLPDDLIIQSIYSYIQHVEPSELVSDTTHHESIHKMLSPSLRSVIRAHGTMREWLIAHLVAPGLGLQVRQERMELYLRSIEVCRSRSADVDLASSMAEVRPPATRSFVEAALLSAVVSPESRVFARAWHNVAVARGGSVDDLLSLMPQRPVQRIPGKRLTIDLGWVIERMLEVITLPDTVESSQPQNLVNFDKRRYLHNLIVNAAGLTPRFKRASETERMDMERLNTMTKEAQSGIYEMRILRDEAVREMAQGSPLMTSKKPVRPFNQLIIAQQEKSKRDRYLRERLAKEKRMEQLRADKRVSVLNRAMQPQKSVPLGQKAARHKKSMSGMSAFFRPLSTAFSSHTLAGDTPRRTAVELDFPVGNLKPAIVLNLVGAGNRIFINDHRPFVFQLDTEDGGHFLLQALGHKERETWMGSIKKTAEVAAMRRLTYLGQSKAKYNELAELSKNPPAKPSRVFGHDLEEVLSRESPTGEYIPGSLPRVVEMCLTEIEKRGLTEVGLYRIAGSRSVSIALRAEFDGGRPVDLSLDGNYPDIHVIGDVLRQWLRELPETIFTNKLYPNFVDAMKIVDYDDRNAMIRLLLWQLPGPNFDLVRRILEHLDRVTDFEEHNQMSSDALAICFNLTLFRSGLDDMKYTHALIKTCITQFHSFFSDPEHDHEGEPDIDVVEGNSDSDSGSGDNELHVKATADSDPNEMVSLNTPKLLGPAYENPPQPIAL